MADQWFYALKGAQNGPVSAEELKAMLIDRRVAWTDLVWREGLPNWIEAQSAFELHPHASAPPSAPNSTPSTMPPAQQMEYLNPRGIELTYAGFWLRLAAYFVDAIILTVPLTIVAFAYRRTSPSFQSPIPAWIMLGLSGGNFLLQTVTWWLYYALFESSPYQATPGKMVLGLIVTDSQGRPLTFGRATGREFAKIINRFTLGLGYAMAGFTERKQGLHDLIAGTLVLRKSLPDTRYRSI